MMEMKLAPLTASGHHRMLASPLEAVPPHTAAELRAAILARGAADKRGAPLYESLQDMASREGGLLIVNLAQDDARAPIDAYLAKEFFQTLACGAALLARAGNCREILLYAPEALHVESLKAALGEASALGVNAVSGESSQVLREDTALYALLERGELRPDPEGHAYLKSFPTEGLKGRPTLVVDGETACHIACLIARPDAPATKLVAVRASETTLLAEATVGVSVGALLEELGLVAEKAPLVGGLLGRFAAKEELDTLEVRFDRLFDSVTLYTKADCMANALGVLMREDRELSCGKCVLCREGSHHLDQLVSGVTQGKAKRDDLALVEDIAPLIAAGSLCVFGKRMPGPALSALKLHRAELDAHILKKTCFAKTCAAFLDYVIDPMRCTGCTKCLDACEDEAIEGRKGFIHIIDPKLCTKCGACKEVCPEDAVLVGADIRVPRKPVKVGTFGD